MKKNQRTGRKMRGKMKQIFPNRIFRMVAIQKEEVDGLEEYGDLVGGSADQSDVSMGANRAEICCELPLQGAPHFPLISYPAVIFSSPVKRIDQS
jgi:hypothetical protein